MDMAEAMAVMVCLIAVTADTAATVVMDPVVTEAMADTVCPIVVTADTAVMVDMAAVMAVMVCLIAVTAMAVAMVVIVRPIVVTAVTMADTINNYIIAEYEHSLDLLCLNYRIMWL